MTLPDDTISVLLPVYAGVNPEHLEQAVESVLAQTHPANEIVVVEDGPLDSGHHEILRGLERRHPAVIRVRLSMNHGPGVANQAGLQVATGEWIAKVDADDISAAERFMLQLAHLRRTGTDVCGGSILEFDEDISRPTAARVPPFRHEEIARRMKVNNPVNHPTAMYRRTLALANGGYPDMRFAEDYVLFARMLRAGARFTNLQAALVYFRADARMHARRALRGQARVEWRLQRELVASGIVSRPRGWWNLGLRIGYRCLPGPVRGEVHRRILGRAIESPDGGG